MKRRKKKYDKAKHRERLDIILNNWDEIIKIIEEEIPSSEYIEKLLILIDAPKTVEDIGLKKDILPMTFKATKDIRDKYVLSRLCFDLGIIDKMCNILKE